MRKSERMAPSVAASCLPTSESHRLVYGLNAPRAVNRRKNARHASVNTRRRGPLPCAAADAVIRKKAAAAAVPAAAPRSPDRQHKGLEVNNSRSRCPPPPRDDRVRVVSLNPRLVSLKT